MTKVKDLSGIITTPMRGLCKGVVTARYTRDHLGESLSLEHAGVMFLVDYEAIVKMIQNEDDEEV